MAERLRPIAPDHAASARVFRIWGITAAVLTLAFSVSACSAGELAAEQREAAPVFATPTVNAGQPTHAWRFDEEDASLDSGPTGQKALKAGPSVRSVPGVSGEALQFAGDGEYADAGEALVATDFADYSIAAWVRMDAVDDDFHTFVSQDGGEDSAFMLQYAGPEHEFAFSFPYVRALAVTLGKPQVGQWYHLVGVRDAKVGTISIYVNGIIAGSAGVPRFVRTTPGPFVVGRGLSQGKVADSVSGSVDDVQVFDRALDDDQVVALFTTSSP